MRLDLRPSRSSDVIPFQSCSLRTLDEVEFANAYSGVTEDGALAWVYKGAVLEVVRTCSGQRVASFNVQHWLRDEQATIKCVCEFRCQGQARLVIGVNGEAEQGMVVLLDIATSSVIRAIEIPQQVSIVEKVLTYGGGNVPQWALSEQLRQFYGILAVGTEGGYLYLIDMGLDSISDGSLPKVTPCPLRMLHPQERNVESVRQQASNSGQHLALPLGVHEQMNSNDCFHFRRPDLSVVQTFNEDEVNVSSLKYIPQSGTLAVGYSFGGFHLWKLFNPVLEYASAVEPEDLPVAFFVYQEPENDPKNFAYMWVCRDDRVSEQKQESLCAISLFQLSYAHRTFYANYGNFFEELNSVTFRMEHNLTVEPYNSRNTTTWSSQLRSAFTISDPNYRPPANLTINDSFDEGLQGPDLSLCAFVWEAVDSRPGGQTDIYLALFDMNRWYHAQMPSRIKCVNVGGREVCPYLAVYNMNDAVLREAYGDLLDLKLRPGSLLRFLSTAPMPPEQHFYPSSLAFDTICVLSNGIVSASILGVQRQVLSSLESTGPVCLLKPFDLYHRCVQTGLLARLTDSASGSSSDEQQRMALLTLALERGQIRFITNCVHCWADGDFYQQGCSLQFLLSWAWSRVTAVKQQIDTTCQPLFDWSGAPVDQRMLQVLQNCLCCLGHLKTLLYMLLTQSTPVTDQGQVELQYRIKVVTLLNHHLKVVLWFVHNGLLPEHNEEDDLSPSAYIYPAQELSQVFKEQRRHVTQPLGQTKTHDLILIDALVHSAGDTVSTLWKSEEGSGVYPPPSLHAALSLYLLENVDDNIKNAIILYLLFDMAAVARGQQEQFAEKITLFAKTFDLSMGLVHQVHAFWLIDHMNFEEGLLQMFRHTSNQDLGAWQHSCILRALVHHGEVEAASRYLSIRNPPIRTAQDLQMRLTVLIANRLVWQAVAHVRYNCGPLDQEKMLRFIFQQCQQRKLMEVLFRLPLTEQEDSSLQAYLCDSADTTSAELLVLHLLQRASYVPAIQLNDRMKHRATMDKSAKARERSKTRNVVVDCYRSSLPAAQQYLIGNAPTASKAPVTRKIDVPRPKPLSTVVTRFAERRANSQSALILAVMDKVAEAGKVLKEDRLGEEREEERGQVGSSALTQHKRNMPESDTSVISKPGPFLCTPSTPKLCKRLSVSSQVVYPSVKEAKTEDLLSAAALSSPVSSFANASLRQSRVFTADCMSLLQTPKIDHTPAKPASPLSRTNTPHSILKVTRRRSRTPTRAKGAALSPLMQPKRLGFSSQARASPPLPSTPTSLTPSSTPSPTQKAPPQFHQEKSGAEVSAAQVATPKQIRFAEPETREISPAYVSPDNLSRRPLRSSESKDSPQESLSNEEMVVSDEEVTFNFSRQATEAMDTENESDVSTAPLATPSPGPASPSRAPPTPAPRSPPSPATTADREIQEAGVSKQPLSKSSPASLSPRVSPGQQRRSFVREGSAGAQDEEAFTKISPRERERSPLSVRSVEAVESRLKRRDLRDRASPELSPRTRSQSSSERRDVVKQTSFTRETRQVSRLSRDEVQVRVVSEQTSTETTAVVVKKTSSSFPQDTIPVIECEDGSQAPPAHTAESMETIEPAEESLLQAVRQARTRASERGDKPGMVEVSEDEADDDLPDLEVQPPTPIQLESQAKTPERSARPPRLSRRGREGSSASSTEAALEERSSQPTPSKLRRTTPRRTAEQEVEWFTEMPPLQIEVSDEENSNDNHPQPLLLSKVSQRGSRRSASVSPLRRSGRRSQDSSPVAPPSEKGKESLVAPPSPSSSLPSPRLRSGRTGGDKSPSPPRRATRSVDRSPPPPSPSRRSLRKSADRSPPPSPSRRVTRSVDRSPPPPSPSRQSRRKSLDRSPPASPSRKSARKSVDRSPPPSPSRRSRKSVDRSPPPSPSGRSARKSADRPPKPVAESLTVQTGLSSDEAMPPPSSPARRATRVRTPERTSSRKTSASSTSSQPEDAASSLDEEEVFPKSPGRRSSQRARTPDPTKAPGSVKDEEKAEALQSPGRRSTRRSSITPDVTAETSSLSPARRSSRRAKTPDRSAVVTPPGKETGAEKEKRDAVAKSVPPIDDEDPFPPSAKREGERDSKTPASPGRTATRASRSASVSESESASVSPSRRSTRSETSGSMDIAEEPSEVPAGTEVDSTPATRRATRGKSKTPERSPARSGKRLRNKGGEGAGGESGEVKDIAMVTEEVRSSRRQQKETTPRTSTDPSFLPREAEETGDAPSFQFAPPTPLSRIQAESSLAAGSSASAFVFSPPITRTSQAHREAGSSTALADNSSQATLAPEADAAPDSSATTRAAGGRKTGKTRKSVKRLRSAVVPGASPSDSPINMLSPRDEEAGSERQTERGAGLPARRTQAKGTRVLRKRKAKLW